MTVPEAVPIAAIVPGIYGTTAATDTLKGPLLYRRIATNVRSAVYFADGGVTRSFFCLFFFKSHKKKNNCLAILF